MSIDLLSFFTDRQQATFAMQYCQCLILNQNVTSIENKNEITIDFWQYSWQNRIRIGKILLYSTIKNNNYYYKDRQQNQRMKCVINLTIPIVKRDTKVKSKNQNSCGKIFADSFIAETTARAPVCGPSNRGVCRGGCRSLPLLAKQIGLKTLSQSLDKKNFIIIFSWMGGVFREKNFFRWSKSFRLGITILKSIFNFGLRILKFIFDFGLR